MAEITLDSIELETVLRVALRDRATTHELLKAVRTLNGTDDPGDQHEVNLVLSKSGDTHAAIAGVIGDIESAGD